MSSSFGLTGGRLSGFSWLLQGGQLCDRLVSFAFGLLPTLALGAKFLANPVLLAT